MKDQDQIVKTIETYFECMSESSAEKVHEAFHPNARIAGHLEDELQEMSVTDFASLVQTQRPSAKDKVESLRADTLSIDIAGNTAVARVRVDFLDKTFLDTLSMIKDGGQWSVYNKLFHVETPST